MTMKMGPDMAPTTTAAQEGYRSHPAQSATVPEIKKHLVKPFKKYKQDVTTLLSQNSARRENCDSRA